MKKENTVFCDKPYFLYRSVGEIKRDVVDIKERISEINRSFSIRELLLEMVSCGENKSEVEWIYDLEALLGEAENTRKRLLELTEELELLEAEMGESGCRIQL
jgi:hypothetical protein